MADHPNSADVLAEVTHWNAVEEQARAGGDRMFWLQHPRVAMHYEQKSLIDGMLWQYWLPKAVGGPLQTALELGCGNGRALSSLLRVPSVLNGVGIDFDEARFAETRETLGTAGAEVRLIAADINQIRLEENSYDLIYSIQAFHHFDNLEHIFAEIERALRPGGFCVLDEYVGPARFQWTDLQLNLTAKTLGLLALPLRTYRGGVEKRAEARSAVEEVIRVCPSEAIRADEIVPLFHRAFDVLHYKHLGGTIQHLLYSGIIHNFADNDPATDQVIDCIDGLERTFIEQRLIPSDFALLIGRKRGAIPEARLRAGENGAAGNGQPA
jgi:SAM-dependent methyltransferase